MKFYRDINNPISVLHEIQCDRCGEHRSTDNNNWSNQYKQEEFITIEKRTRNNGYKIEEIDCCPKCWVDVKLALEYLGFTFLVEQQ